MIQVFYYGTPLKLLNRLFQLLFDLDDKLIQSEKQLESTLDSLNAFEKARLKRDYDQHVGTTWTGEKNYLYTRKEVKKPSAKILKFPKERNIIDETEDVADGGIAGMLGERTSYRDGKTAKKKNQNDGEKKGGEIKIVKGDCKPSKKGSPIQKQRGGSCVAGYLYLYTLEDSLDWKNEEKTIYKFGKHSGRDSLKNYLKNPF